MKFEFILFLAILIVIGAVALVGCDESNIDVGKHAIIELPNGEVVEGEVESLTRWSSSVVEVTIDGNTYMVHPLNLAIVEKGD